MTEPTPAAADTAPRKPQFGVQRLYVKDISFESPGAPAVFTQAWEPEVAVQFSSNATRVADKQYEVVLKMNVTATQQGKTAYIAEVSYAGVFLIDGVEGANLEHLLGSHCPSIIFPYVREVISDLVVRGTFPQFLLQPINFDAIFNDARRRRDQEAAEAAAKH